MNENEQKPKRTNEEFLKDTLKYQGFGESLYPALETQLKSGADKFSLPISLEHDGKTVDYKLNFGKSKNGDHYFFNNFEAVLKGQDNLPGTKQVFYLDNGKGITAKESFNLLEGRSAKKEMLTKDNVAYKAWAKLDFNETNEKGQHKVQTYGEGYGYDLPATLAKFTIREMDDAKHSEWLLKNLERGNLQPVLMVRGENRVNDPNDVSNSERKTFIAAAPEFKSLHVYDENKKKLYVVSDNNAKIQQSGTEGKQKNNTRAETNGQQVKQAPKTETGKAVKTETPKRTGPKR